MERLNPSLLRTQHIRAAAPLMVPPGWAACKETCYLPKLSYLSTVMAREVLGFFLKTYWIFAVMKMRDIEFGFLDMRKRRRLWKYVK